MDESNEEAVENMDAFKELMTRMPNLEIATLEELRTISIFSKTAAAYGRHLIEAAAKFPDRLGPQSAKWLEDSQRAMETHIFTEAERGKRAKEADQTRATEPLPQGRGSVPSREPLKWKRLGFDSEKEMETAEFLDSHRGEAKRIIAEAKDSKDVPSKGAIKEAVKRRRAEEKVRAFNQKKNRNEKPDIDEVADGCISKLSEVNAVLKEVVAEASEARIRKIISQVMRAAKIIKESGGSKWALLE